mgnify:CR=1 FL=1
MYQGEIFWIEQVVAYCIALILWCIIDTVSYTHLTLPTIA